MADPYVRFTSSSIGAKLARTLGLPRPVPLKRGDHDLSSIRVLLGGTVKSRLLEPARTIVADIGATDLAATDAGAIDTDATDADAHPNDGTADRPDALVFDASGIEDASGLRAVYDFFHLVIRQLRANGRVLVLATPPGDCTHPSTASAQQALEGFVRSVGKELGRGCTAQLIQVSDGAEDAMASTLRFFVSGRSAYISGQVIELGRHATDASSSNVNTADASTFDWRRPLADRVAVVTGAARGIGAEIARTLARDGATVVCVDVPAQGDALAAVAGDLEGAALQLDITGPDAPATLTNHLRDRHGGVDVVVHNAGILRDRTLGRMTPDEWGDVLRVNLGAQEALDDALLGSTGLLRDNGRIITIASISGIAGNRGQTNYSASKAGVIGRVRALSGELARRGATINAIAPGFIETAMTRSMPAMVREIGRRTNSLGQGGLPIDVAETVAWLASPGSYAVNGNVVRVCGQSLLGA